MPIANDETLRRLALLETSILSDILDEAGFSNQVLSRSIGLLPGSKKLAGFAQCLAGGVKVETRTKSPPDARRSPHYFDHVARKGGVLVVSTNGFDGGAILGGLLATELKTRGCSGFVTDGLVRDTAEILALGPPVAAAGVSPVNGTRRWTTSVSDCPVGMPAQGGGSITVTPGDLILGDADGIVVLPLKHAEALIAMAEELTSKELLIQQDMKLGMSREEAFAKHPRFSHVTWLNS